MNACGCRAWENQIQICRCLETGVFQKSLDPVFSRGNYGRLSSVCYYVIAPLLPRDRWSLTHTNNLEASLPRFLSPFFKLLLVDVGAAV
jgi:hypothetical protein